MKDNFDLMFIQGILALAVLIILFSLFFIMLKDSNNENKLLDYELSKIKNITFTLFDCRIVNNNNLIIGLKNDSFNSVVEQKITWNYSKSHLVQNPRECKVKNNYCEEIIIEDYNETAAWLVENQACDTFFIRIGDLI